MGLDTGTFRQSEARQHDWVLNAPTGYACILADPPWSFKNWSDKGKNRNPDAMVRQKGLAERHYATMSMDDIRKLPVGDIAEKDCALFMWAVDCMLPEAIEVGRGWGFKYKTVAFTWVKEKTKTPGFHIGLGYWTRGNPEQCLLFVRGKVQRQSASVRQLIVSQRREHSRKPDVVRASIQSLVKGPYLELFAREPAPGWDCWGNQTEKFEAAK